MIDRWFKDDVEKVLSQHNRLVITDALGEDRFLMDELPGDVVLMEVAPDDLSEIEARYDAELNHPQKSVVFYTSQSKADLSFLLKKESRRKVEKIKEKNQNVLLFGGKSVILQQ